MSECEWDPVENAPARLVLMCDQPEVPYAYEHYGCTNEATLLVGANGLWRLCGDCASLPAFRRYRVRRPVAVRS